MENDFIALRHALIGDELKHLQVLRDELDDKIAYTNRMSNNLPLAIVQSAADSDQLVNSMKLPVLSSMTLAVDSHREQVTQMLAPVIMPVIGQAVAKSTQEIKDSIESLTSSMFTAQGIKWRIESARTGKPYSEIAFREKHHFIVEHLVLSAKRNGEVLSQCAKQSYMDSNDSKFRFIIDNHIQTTAQKVTITADEQALETKSFDSMTAYTAHGVWCSLTAVVTGEASEEFLAKLRKQLKSIEIDSNAALKAYRTDTSAFEPMNKTLGQVLAFVPSKPAAAKDKKAGGFSLMKLLMWLALLAVLAYIAFSIYSGYEKRSLVQAFAQQKGFVTSDLKGDAWSGWTVTGMQDPNLFNAKKLDIDDSLRDKLSINAIPFVSLSKESILARLGKKITPPAGVQYSIDDKAPNTLVVSGTSDEAWLAKLKTVASTVEGIDSVNTTAVVSAVDYKAAFEAAKKTLESLTFTFVNKAGEFAADQQPALAQAEAAMKALIDSSAKTNSTVSFVVATHTSGASPRSENTKLLSDRYSAVLGYFVEKQFNQNLFQYAEQVEKPLNLAGATITVVQNAK